MSIYRSMTREESGSNDYCCKCNMIFRLALSMLKTTSGVKRNNSTRGMEELISQFL